MPHSTNEIVSFLDSIYNEKSCQELALRSEFTRRSSSKLKGHELIKVLTLPNEGISEASLNSLCMRLKEFNPQADISASALAQRINTHAAVELMKKAFQTVLREARDHSLKRNNVPEGVLANFNNVFIQDSTVFELNQHLQPIYKGARNGGDKSQLKIDTIHNYTTGIIANAKMLSGNVPDQGLSNRILDFITDKDLVIRDLGYFVLNVFKQIAEKNAYYISRLPPHLKLYLNLHDSIPLNLAKYLDTHFRNQFVIDLQLYVGSERLPTRLIAYKVPENVVRERLRKARKRSKDSKRVLSDAKRNLLKYSLFITNASEELIAAKMVGTIYRLRWEIELIFKQWKSLLKIDVLRGISQHRIECLMWGRLCMVIVVGIINYVYMECSNKLYNQEISCVKLTAYLMHNGKLNNAISKNRIYEFLQELEKILLRRLLKDKRARKTMRERITMLEPYYEEVCHA